MAEVPITGVHVKVAGAASRARGTMAYASFIVGGELRLDGFTIRRGRGRLLYVAYPRRRTPSGSSYPYVAPTSAKTRARLETILIDALLDAELDAREGRRGRA